MAAGAYDAIEAAMRETPPNPQRLADARGRLAAMLVAGEQLSLDRGSWLLGLASQFPQ